MFAKNPGAVAAPTAALHFDEALLAAADARGVQRAHVTLHVGAGTFQPVKTENLAEHQMHSEWYEVPAATQQAIAECRARGGRIIAVGTTTVRTLESWAKPARPQATRESSSRRGLSSSLVDLLVTNFHLPKSSLMMLVSAFAGYEPIMALYRHAIAQRVPLFQLWRRHAAGTPTLRHTQTPGKQTRMNTFQKRTAIRIAAVSILLASLASPIAWYVARESAEESIVALAVEESGRLLHQFDAIDSRAAAGQPNTQPWQRRPFRAACLTLSRFMTRKDASSLNRSRRTATRWSRRAAPWHAQLHGGFLQGPQTCVGGLGLARVCATA